MSEEYLYTSSDDYNKILQVETNDLTVNNRSAEKSISIALSKINLETTFDIIVQLRNMINNCRISNHEDDLEIQLKYGTCIIDKYKDRIDNKLTYTVGYESNKTKTKNKHRDEIIYDIINTLHSSYSIENLLNMRKHIGNNCCKRVSLGDILVLITHLATCEPDLSDDEFKNASVGKIIRNGKTLIDKMILTMYRSNYNFVSLSLYLMQPSILNMLKNSQYKELKDILMHEIHKFDDMIPNQKPKKYVDIKEYIKDSMKILSIEELKSLESKEFRTYMLINPVIKLNESVVILDNHVINGVYCKDYISRFINEKDKAKLNSDYGYNQERLIETLINKIFSNEYISIEKMLESDKYKTYDFDIKYEEKVIIHAESKFAIGNMTTHNNTEHTDRKAMKQLKEHSKDNIENIIISTASSYLYENIKPNLKIKSLSILGVLGYLFKINCGISFDIEIQKDVFKRNSCLEILGTGLIMTLLDMM